MSKPYSLYEVKARLSEFLRMVREGQTITITYHGNPIAELRPYEGDGESIEHRLDRLAARGSIVRPKTRAAPPSRVAKRPGALQRFLAERD